MRYVVLIHSNPPLWGHPTSDYLAEHRALPQADRDRLQAEFERVLGELDARGELVHAEALGDPSGRRLHRVHAVRGHLLQDVGDTDGALAAYREAARLTASRPEQRYLLRRAERLVSAAGRGSGG